MEAYSVKRHSELTFPETPDYQATVVPIYWEPVMGSGERIAAIIAAIGEDLEIEVSPVIKPSILGVMFPGQKRNARNMLTWVSSSMKRHLASGYPLNSWKCPITGFTVGQGTSSIGDSLADMINQAKLLYCSLAVATSVEDQKVPTSRSAYDTDTVRSFVIDSVRRSLGTHAESFIVPGGVRMIREDDHNHFIELAFEDEKRVASIVSAHYATTDTVQRHILSSQSDLLVAAQQRKHPMMYIAMPKDAPSFDKESRVKVENLVDELDWKLKKVGVSPQIHDSADEIAESVCESWS